MTGIIITILAAAVLLVAVVVFAAMAIKSAHREKENAINMLKESHEVVLAGVKESYERTLAELKKSHEESLGQQFDPELGKVFMECRQELEAFYDENK